jgi:hypothetical protein
LFWHDLTALIGGVTVAELQERMSGQEFLDWIAWAKIRGMFGEERADLRNGLLCALLVNVATAFAGKTGKAKATDYMPYYEKPKPDPTDVAETKKQIQALESVFGVREG